jgi:methyl-accepting chemotaxis protein
VANSNTTSRRFRLHHIYFALAAFDVLAVCSGLYLSHRFMTIYTDSVTVNQTLAAHLNAPGNDVFDSRDVTLETRRRDEALKAFNAQLGKMRQALQGDAPALKGALDNVETAMAEMLIENDLIFKYFANQEPDKAAERMATMDRKYGILTRQVNEATDIVRGIQDDYLMAQLELADSLRRYEYVIGSVIFFMVGFVTLLGHKIGKAMKKSEDDARAHAAELQSTNRMVKELNSELMQSADRVKKAEDETARTGRTVAFEQAALITTLGASLERLARGDLTVHLETRDNDTFRQIKADFNTTVRHLHNTLELIASTTEAVAGEASNIADIASDLASRTEQQASSLEETAASMEEMSATVRQNAGNAQQAKQAVNAASNLAASGRRIADGASAAMTKIEGSSREITAIVSLIEEIAFQTNILALNAAVEAARAGEAGSGFAVVAHEVRSLSQRSGQALKDVKALIGSSNASVKEGVGLVANAGAALSDISVAVTRAAGLVAEIAAASMEQSAGLDQVSTAVSNMDQMTQQNAVLVEETNAALHAAQSQVAELQRAVAFFKTSADNPAAASAHRERPALRLQQA